MITIDQALKYVLDNTIKLETVLEDLSDLYGKVLAQDVYSDIDMPPFNKSAMDGYSVRIQDIQDLPVKLNVIDEVSAGEYKEIKLQEKECIKIMTGAPVPISTDTVIKIEDTEKRGQNSILIKRAVKKGSNICSKGEDIRKGQCVLTKGMLLRGPEIAALASCGTAKVNVYKTPSVCSISTGNELAEPGEPLSYGKIRNSNAYLLMNLFQSIGCKLNYLGIAKDTKEHLLDLINKGLKYDVLVISGAVSMGDYDLVPDVLRDINADIIFHNVAVKPGKPFLFAKKNKTHIFCAPGNPVSNFTTFYMFIRSAVYKMMGRDIKLGQFVNAKITQAYKRKGDRAWLLPANIYLEQGQYFVTPLTINGSADITGCLGCNSIIVVDKDTDLVETGSNVKCIQIVSQ